MKWTKNETNETDETRAGMIDRGRVGAAIDCGRAAALLPLYAAGDLEAARAGEVASHVETCEPCRALAGEFAESRRLLAEALATPEFGAEFYAEIRSDVLARVSADREPASPSGFIASLFFGRRRLVYAASLAALAVACLVASQHFRRDKSETPREIADAVRGTPEARVEQTGMTPQTAQQSSLPSSPKPRRHAGNEQAAAKLHNTTGRYNSTAVVPRNESAFVAQAVSSSKSGAPSVVASGANVGEQPAVESASPSARGVSAGGEVSRIEIQTADPTIRIIWLTPLKQEEPKPDRDNHENGDRK